MKKKRDRFKKRLTGDEDVKCGIQNRKTERII